MKSMLPAQPKLRRYPKMAKLYSGVLAVKVHSWAAIRAAAPSSFETRRYLWNVLKRRPSVAHFVCRRSFAPSVHSH